MAKARIVVLGAGGFARELRWLIEEVNAASDRYEFLGYVLSDMKYLGERDSKAEVLGDFSWLVANRRRVDALAIGIGTPSVRLQMAAALAAEFAEDAWPHLIHPSVRFDRGSTTLGAGSILCAGTIGTVNVRVEPFAMVNLSCTLGHECVVGRGAVLNPSVNVSGSVVIEEGVLVGTGAQILQELRIGKGSTVGAGAVVTRDVAAGTTVVGAPAKPLQKR